MVVFLKCMMKTGDHMKTPVNLMLDEPDVWVGS